MDAPSACRTAGRSPWEVAEVLAAVARLAAAEALAVVAHPAAAEALVAAAHPARAEVLLAGPVSPPVVERQ